MSRAIVIVLTLLSINLVYARSSSKDFGAALSIDDLIPTAPRTPNPSYSAFPKLPDEKTLRSPSEILCFEMLSALNESTDQLRDITLGSTMGQSSSSLDHSIAYYYDHVAGRYFFFRRDHEGKPIRAIGKDEALKAFAPEIEELYRGIQRTIEWLDNAKADNGIDLATNEAMLRGLKSYLPALKQRCPDAVLDRMLPAALKGAGWYKLGTVDFQSYL